ncbi:hypothetical protein EP331_10170 [bacterium]|nr:MAG: hypothetical protein EP331_10170 [bacterium]
MKNFTITLGIMLLISGNAFAQSAIIDPVDLSYRGNEAQIARGVMDGNLLESNYRNHGEYSRYGDTPYGVWPRGTGNRHIDGIGFYVLGRVWANRLDYPDYFPNVTTDTLIANAEHNYRADAGGVLNPKGPIWGWLPLPGFHKQNRLNPTTLQREPNPATSTDQTTWPDFWPDKQDNIDDPGWAGQWNGYFGKGVFQADFESYYVMDDHLNGEYALDKGVPNSPNLGVFYPNAQDSTILGLGLLVKVRILQWANILAEDAAFMLYEIVNRGGYDHGGKEDEGLYFMKIIDFGLGDETDGLAEFDAVFDVAFGWDANGKGTDASGREYPIGYVGFAFLESPSLPENLLDDDEDGITDERRNSGPGVLITGQAAIRAYVEANYDEEKFNAWENGTSTGPLENRLAYQAGYWWTGDENMNWLSYEDENGNGKYDPGEFQNDDVGRDGIGSFEYFYTGPDEGEGDGIPTAGEPNFDRTDVDESDQIGLRGFDLAPRMIYQPANPTNLQNDAWLWDRVFNKALFPLGTPRSAFIAGTEPFMMFVSGPVKLEPNSSDFFSLAWLFGATREDFYRNRIIVQRIYNANYRFAEAPIMPTISAIAGDGRVIIAWDNLSIASFDKFSRSNDFEGYRLYRGTDPLLSDIRTITDIDGTPTFYKPMVQYDLDNGIKGPVPVLENRSVFNLGDDTGLKFFHIDSTVNNGVTYYYAVTAYDHGVFDTLDGGLVNFSIDPQENVFNFKSNAFNQVLNSSRNAKAVTPKAKAAGYVEGSANEDLNKVTSGYGTGSIAITIVDPALVDYNAIYELSFVDSVINEIPYNYQTNSYILKRVDTDAIIASGDMAISTPYTEGFFATIYNDEGIVFNPEKSGWVGNIGSENEIINSNATEIDGYSTNLITRIDYPNVNSQGWRYTSDNFELRFFDQNVYYPPRFQTSVYLRDSLKMMAYNIDKLVDGNPTPVQILVIDSNNDGKFNYDTDELFITEQIGSARYPRQRIRFNVVGSTVIEPKAGDVIRVSNSRPFRTGDFFQFTIGSPSFDEELAKSELDKIKVVPNPYVGTNVLEVKTATQSGLARAERRIMFNHLPAECIISIYNVRGELVKRIVRNAPESDGTEYWDLLNKDNQDVAYGVYVFHVKAPGIGEKIGKFALIK